jgi:hypothetical protein
MTDQQIIDAAKQAGLCFPGCWNLDVTDVDIADETLWVQDGYNKDPAVGKRRQDIFEDARRRREEHMRQLRRFVQLIQAA